MRACEQSCLDTKEIDGVTHTCNRHPRDHDTNVHVCKCGRRWVGETVSGDVPPSRR